MCQKMWYCRISAGLVLWDTVEVVDSLLCVCASAVCVCGCVIIAKSLACEDKTEGVHLHSHPVHAPEVGSF